MSKLSSGILVYRFNQAMPEVLLVHPGGPFYSKKDLGVWSVPKGEYDPGEDPLEVAKREFFEETGNQIVQTEFISLTDVYSKGGKLVKVWATEGDFEKCFISSNDFEMEWPPKSGKMQSFPETDNAAFFSMKEAKKKVFAYQIPIIEELEKLLESNEIS